MYTKLERVWTTSLCSADSESCIVTTLLPCHVYAKLNLVNYGIHFVSYALLVLCIRNVYSSLIYFHTYHCPSIKTDQCFLMEKEDCSRNYMVVDGVTTPCYYNTDLDVCIFSQTACIVVHSSTYTTLSILLSLSYCGLFYMNYRARQLIRNTYSISPSHECIASTSCSICGLAQAYREIV
jgi:hypothetical protein